MAPADGAWTRWARPRLAGIGYPYVVKQLSDLAAGKRTPDGAGAVMVVFAAD